ncbi:GUN4 N-terminal ARM-like repeat domain-containing protein [Pantanalinema sp. GBBB05]|uniref:GUN4 N-terminal ARM-like repeat domain-containing protein n=1 Tax=Pantanalinema sp. GBBB05 TaxID=2604139 RepID=UPI001D4D561B|nr:hypothetical protein [Pantanalinema sp. GBBB05]
MKHPEATDGVLGGQVSPPINSVILGGIEGLQQQLTMASPEQQSQLLATALNYGEAGIDLLITTLNSDPVLSVRATAYQLLQSVDSAKVEAAIANGILVNPGDPIYSVYKSAISFDDEYFHLETDFFEEYESFESSLQNLGWQEMGYESYEDCYEDHLYDYQSYVPQRHSRHISRAEAENAADLLHQQLVWEWDEQNYTAGFNISSIFHDDLENWCTDHQVNCEKQFISAYALSDWLKASGNQKLFAELWRDAIGNFAFRVCLAMEQ